MCTVEEPNEEFTSRHSLEWKFLFLDHRYGLNFDVRFSVCDNVCVLLWCVFFIKGAVMSFCFSTI